MSLSRSSILTREEASVSALMPLPNVQRSRSPCPRNDEGCASQASCGEPPRLPRSGNRPKPRDAPRRGVAVDREHPILEGDAQHRLDLEVACIVAPARREDGGTVLQLSFAYSRDEQVPHRMADAQRRTPGSGESRISSETTLVSSSVDMASYLTQRTGTHGQDRARATPSHLRFPTRGRSG